MNTDRAEITAAMLVHGYDLSHDVADGTELFGKLYRLKDKPHVCSWILVGWDEVMDAVEAADGDVGVAVMVMDQMLEEETEKSLNGLCRMTWSDITAGYRARRMCDGIGEANDGTD